MPSASPRPGSLLGLHVTRRLHLRVDSPTFDAHHSVSRAIRPKYSLSASLTFIVHWAGDTPTPTAPRRLSSPTFSVRYSAPRRPRFPGHCRGAIHQKYFPIVSAFGICFRHLPDPLVPLGREHPSSYAKPLSADSPVFGTRDSAPRGLNIGPIYNWPLQRFAFGTSICTHTVSAFHLLHSQ